MLEILYYVFIFPLQSVLGLILDSLFELSGSYGFSIIILSILINLFLLRLSNLARQKADSISILQSQLNAKIAEFKRAFKGAELNAYIRTLYKQKHFHPIFALSSLGGLALQVPFFIAIWILIGSDERLESLSFLAIDSLARGDSLLFGLHLLPFLMTIFSLLNVYISSTSKVAIYQGIFISLIFLVLLYSCPSALLLYWSTNTLFALLLSLYHKKASLNKSQNLNASQNRPAKNNPKITHGLTHNTTHKTHTDSSKFVAKQSLFNAIFTKYENLSLKEYKTYRDISIYAIINSLFLIFVFSPYLLYASDVSQFDSTQSVITLGALFGFFMLSSFTLIYLTSFLYKSRLLKLGAWGFGTIVIIGFVQTFIITGNYGAMDNFVFFADPNLAETIFSKSLFHYDIGIKVIFLIICMAIFMFFGFLALKYKFAFIKGLKIATIGLFIASGANVYAISTSLPKQSIEISQEADSSSLLESEPTLFSYSKTDKNIVVIMLDMFSGSHINPLLEQFPYFKSNLSGFVAFDNTASTSAHTIITVPSIINGEQCAFYNMNKKNVKLDDEIARCFIEMGLNFANKSYEIDYLKALDDVQKNIDAKNVEQIKTHNSNENRFFNYLIQNDKLNATNILNEMGTQKHNTTSKLFAYGLFKFAPSLLRLKIYSAGSWLGDSYKYFALSDYRSLASLYAFTHNIKTDSTKPTFKFVHSLFTHAPSGAYYHNGKCEYLTKRTAWEDYPHTKQMMRPMANGRETSVTREYVYQHYDIEACALSLLSEYVENLKESGIYDNTQIFVVSDHSIYNSIDTYVGWIDALFLFKDFNSNGELKVDSRLMANYDPASIFCENIGGCKGVPQNILKNYPLNRQIVHGGVDFITQHKPDKWIVDRVFKVSDSIYGAEHYTELTTQYHNGTFIPEDSH